MEFTHKPVLLAECIEALHIRPEGIYVDGTLGRAGHSREIAQRLTTGRLVCIDRDQAAIDAVSYTHRDVYKRQTCQRVRGDFSVKPALFFRVRIDWREKEGEPMERNLHEPEIYDFRQHDRLWQRVGPGLEPYPETTAEAMPRREELPPAQESQLPGAEPNPCCMGSEARELLAVLEGYIEEELEDRRRYLALSRQAPSWARQTLRDRCV